MQVSMTQHAVGQGGLFTGTLHAGGNPFRWAYDCGSNQLDALTREVGKVANDGDLDMVFLSHLDSDHVNGMDLLLSQVRATEVVIPYMENEVILAILAKDVARGRLTTSFLDLVSDLPTWFNNRGVERITLVRGVSDEDDEGPPVDPPVGGGGEGDITPKWYPEATAGVPPGALAHATLQTREVLANATLALTATHGQMNWVLIPYVHAPPKRLMMAFAAALDQQFGVPLDRKSICDAARTPQGREKLRRCYDALWLDHNLISMTLYAGPASQIGRLTFSLNSFGPSSRGQGGGGWLLTGDADFASLRRRNKFVAHYRPVHSLVTVMMTPHHGSSLNFSPLVLDAFQNLVVAYAAAGPNTYGHPHEDVKDAVEMHPGVRFQSVGLNARTGLLLKVADW